LDLELYSAPLMSVVAQTATASAHGYLQVGDVGIDEIQNRRATTDPMGNGWRCQWPSRSPDICRTVLHISGSSSSFQACSSMRTSKATASTAITTGNLRQGRLMADHGGLCGAYSTKLR
jgi:hypothetical protein